MSDYSDLILSHTPVAYYRLNEATVVNGGTCADSSGNGLHGTFKELATSVAQVTGALTGDTDKAITFGASSPSGVEIYSGTGPYTNLIGNAFNGAAAVSASLWIKRTAADTEIYIFSLWCNNGGTAVQMFGLLNNVTNGFTANARSLVSETMLTLGPTGGSIGTGNWVHVGVVANYAGDNMKIYINGALSLSATKAFTNSAYTYVAPAALGNSTTGGSDRIGFYYLNKHTTDEVAFFASELSASQFAEQYAIGKQYKNNFLMRPKRAIGYYSVRHLRL